MKYTTAVMSALIGFSVIAAANTAYATGPADMCDTGARILCGAPVIPAKPAVKPVPKYRGKLPVPKRVAPPVYKAPAHVSK